MDALAQIDMVVELLERFGVEVRRERMGGSGGGLCRMRGRQVLFLDEDADAATRLERCAAGLAMMPESESVFLPPELRERVERMRAGKRGRES